MPQTTRDRAQRVASQNVYTHIRRLILEGALVPGERIVEERLGAELHVSRTPVREALAMLESEGFVVSEARRGAVVRAFAADEIRDVYDLRALLEGHIASEAAKRATPVLVQIMKDANTKMRSVIVRGGGADSDLVPLEDLRAVFRYNDEFHRAILLASGSRRAEAVLRNIVEIPLMLNGYSWFTRAVVWSSWEDHDRVIRAIEEGESRRAEMLMAEHVLQARDTLLAELDRQQGLTEAVAAG